jgi:hypothetical protein
MRKTFDQIAGKYPDSTEAFAAIKPFYLKGEEFDLLDLVHVFKHPAQLCIVIMHLIQEGLIKQSYGYVFDGVEKRGRWETPLDIPHELLGLTVENDNKADMRVFLTPQGEYTKK